MIKKFASTTSAANNFSISWPQSFPDLNQTSLVCKKKKGAIIVAGKPSSYMDMTISSSKYNPVI
jgi:hypothetical protein